MLKNAVVPLILGACVLLWFGAYFFTQQTVIDSGPPEVTSPTNTPVTTSFGILRNTGYNTDEIATANNLNPEYAQFQIVTFDQPTLTTQHHLISHLTDSAALTKLKNLTLQDSGKCINLTALTTATPKPVADYLASFTLLTVQDFTLTEDFECYTKNAGLYPSQPSPANLPKPFTVTTTILPTLRPSYDIGYDYEITLPWSEAKALGYGDASGLDHPATQPTRIFVIASNLDTAIQIEKAKRFQKPVSIQGRFMGGYAESTVLEVQEIIEVE